MLSDKLLEEIIYISKKGKLIDRPLICRIVFDIISNTDEITKNKFNFFAFSNKNHYLGLSNPLEGTLLLSINNCYKYVKNLKIPTLEKNLYIVSIILHEVEHLKEYSKEKNNEFEGKLIYISNYADSYKDSKQNQDNYYKNPSEKIAYAMSWKNLFDIINNYPDSRKINLKTYNFINGMYIENLKYGYERNSDGKYNVPLLDFLVGIKRLSLGNEVFKLVPKEECNASKFCVEKKFMYGFPITNKDMKELNKKKILMLKY